jgi:hypothetical protein
MDDVNDWVDQKLMDVAQKLPSQAHDDPASFACGYNTGYKQALLDIKREFNGE